MKTVRVRIDPSDPDTLRHARIDLAKVDATTEHEIQTQIDEDEKEAMLDADRYVATVRKSLSLSQAEFAQLFNVSPKTIRHWEQGKRFAPGPAKTLLQILSFDPQAVFSALGRTAPRSPDQDV